MAVLLIFKTNNNNLTKVLSGQKILIPGPEESNSVGILWLNNNRDLFYRSPVLAAERFSQISGRMSFMIH